MSQVHKEFKLPHGDGVGVRTIFLQSNGHESIAANYVPQAVAALAGLFVVAVNAAIHVRHQLRYDSKTENVQCSETFSTECLMLPRCKRSIQKRRSPRLDQCSRLGIVGFSDKIHQVSSELQI